MGAMKETVIELFELLCYTDTPIDVIASRMNITSEEVIDFLYSETYRTMFFYLHR